MQTPNDLPVKQKLRADSLFKISRMKEVIKPTRPHKHRNYYELIFLTQGAGFHTIELEVHEVVAPVIFFLRPNQVHCWDFTQIPKGFVLLFREDLFKEVSHLPGGIFSSVSQLPTLLRLVDTRQSDYLVRLMLNMEEDYMRQPTAHTLLTTSLHLVFQKLASWEGMHPSHSHSDLAIVARFRKMIEADFPERQAIRTYAELLHLNEKKLNQACKTVLGKNASQVIQERLLLEAKRLLMYTDLSITEIGYKLYFHDASHFAKFFKKYTQLTPAIYREKARSA